MVSYNAIVHEYLSMPFSKFGLGKENKMLFGDFRDGLVGSIKYYLETTKRESCPLSVDQAFQYLQEDLIRRSNELESGVFTLLGMKPDNHEK
jgi:hypothetical protein